jgi:hypothetical protein
MTTERIDFDKETGLPGSITVTLTLAEAVFISKICGKISPLVASKIEADGDKSLSEIWNRLASDLFCRYWSGGDEDLYTIPGFDMNKACVDYLERQEKNNEDTRRRGN